MIRTTAALTAALFLFIASAGSLMAAGTGEPQQKKVRQQNEKQLQKNKNCDGPQTQVRQRNRKSY